MSLVTVEVAIDHGRVTPIEPVLLPEVGRGLLTILPTVSLQHDRLTPHPLLSKGRILDDPTKPLDAEDWPDSLR